MKKLYKKSLKFELMDHSIFYFASEHVIDGTVLRTK
jgi:hypothetical protein